MPTTTLRQPSTAAREIKPGTKIQVPALDIISATVISTEAVHAIGAPPATILHWEAWENGQHVTGYTSQPTDTPIPLAPSFTALLKEAGELEETIADLKPRLDETDGDAAERDEMADYLNWCQGRLTEVTDLVEALIASAPPAPAPIMAEPVAA